MTGREALKILQDGWIEVYQIKASDEETTKANMKALEAYAYIIKLLESESCEDAVSRKILKEQMIKYGFLAPDMTVTEFVDDLPPVNPQPKTGHWVLTNPLQSDDGGSYQCSECEWGHPAIDPNSEYWNVCPKYGSYNGGLNYV